MTTEQDRLGPALLTLAWEAAAAIMAVYADDFKSRAKADHSPVTDADEAAERIILAGLERLTPGMPVVAEEKSARGDIPQVGTNPFWLVDPLDGTREFIARNGEFTVNIARIERGRPTHGVVLAPALEQGRGIAWLGTPQGARRFHGREDRTGVAIRVRAVPPGGAIALISRSHRDLQTDDWLRRQVEPKTASIGSSLKFCRIAEGAADFYPRFASISEWDTAAGQAVLEAAGGAVLSMEDNRPLTYGKPGFRNPGFIARGA
ncbi:MAG TPA: 3'(2'),5'-bisphosphate nucleotidase CysQ [Ferrovibrio sp.]|uniref:3'(2'),5'-bisphosphate nucleotidase CysQ n=1 Tax=Ferrovibrio sp. TaxID=1917215 RepID=UPI002ED61D44